MLLLNFKNWKQITLEAVVNAIVTYVVGVLVHNTAVPSYNIVRFLIFNSDWYRRASEEWKGLVDEAFQKKEGVILERVSAKLKEKEEWDNVRKRNRQSS